MSNQQPPERIMAEQNRHVLYDPSRMSQDFPGIAISNDTLLPAGVKPFCGRIRDKCKGFICINCFQPGHVVANCHTPRFDGFVHGCPLDNRDHALDECSIIGSQNPRTTQYYFWDLRTGLPELKMSKVHPAEILQGTSTQTGPLTPMVCKNGQYTEFLSTLVYEDPPPSYYGTIHARLSDLPPELKPKERSQSKHRFNPRQQYSGPPAAQQQWPTPQHPQAQYAAAPIPPQWQQSPYAQAQYGPQFGQPPFGQPQHGQQQWSYAPHYPPSYAPQQPSYAQTQALQAQNEVLAESLKKMAESLGSGHSNRARSRSPSRSNQQYRHRSPTRQRYRDGDASDTTKQAKQSQKGRPPQQQQQKPASKGEQSNQAKKPETKKDAARPLDSRISWPAGHPKNPNTISAEQSDVDMEDQLLIEDEINKNFAAKGLPMLPDTKDVPPAVPPSTVSPSPTPNSPKAIPRGGLESRSGRNWDEEVADSRNISTPSLSHQATVESDIVQDIESYTINFSLEKKSIVNASCPSNAAVSPALKSQPPSSAPQDFKNEQEQSTGHAQRASAKANIEKCKKQLCKLEIDSPSPSPPSSEYGPPASPTLDLTTSIKDVKGKGKPTGEDIQGDEINLNDEMPNAEQVAEQVAFDAEFAATLQAQEDYSVPRKASRTGARSASF